MELSDSELEEQVVSIPADPDVKNFSFTVLDDDIYYRENSVMNKVELPMATTERVKGMVKIRDVTNKLLQRQMEDCGDQEVEELQKDLNEVYDSFTAKYGLLSSNANKRAFSQDSSYCLLTSLEFLDEQGNLKRKADIFTKGQSVMLRQLLRWIPPVKHWQCLLEKRHRLILLICHSLPGKQKQN